VSKPEKVAKLQALLARVVSRAAEPRGTVPTRVAVAAERPVAASRPVISIQTPVMAIEAPVAMRAPVAAPAPERPAPAPERPAPPPPPISAPDLDDEVTVAHMVPELSSRRAPEPDAVLEVDVVEVGSEAVIDFPVEEAMAPEALGSRERLVAAEAIASDATELVAVAELVGPPASEEEPAPELIADESDVEEAAELEEAPLSSRRPVVGTQPEEQLAEMAFGTHEAPPPRHTPPPESGRLPAAPAVEFDADVTGVREATPIAVATIAALTRELVPEATVATLPSGDGVADVVGAAQRFQPATFVALLEASLAL
jgi:hypothetical protein